MFKGQKSEHSDLDVALEFSCAQPNALKQLEIPLFKKHPRLSSLKVDMVSPKGQASVTLKAKDPVLRW
jgi:predicted nucleotidyltransferase